MKYPRIRLSATDDSIDYAEFPADPEKGSFLQVRRNSDEVSARVDRFATIPLYYAVHKGELYGATKLDLLLADLPPTFPRALDRVAALQFIRTNSMIGSNTLLKGIQRVPWGTELRWDGREARLHRYWQLPAAVNADMTQDEALEGLRRTFESAVRDYCVDVKTIGVRVSGGMDSRQLLGGTLATGAHPTAFTYGPPRSLDTWVARRLCGKLGLEHVVHSWPAESEYIEKEALRLRLVDGMQSFWHGHGISILPEESNRVDRLLHGHFIDLYLQAHTYNRRVDVRAGANVEAVPGHLYTFFDGGSGSCMRGDAFETEMVPRDLVGSFRHAMRTEIDTLSYLEPEKRYDALYLLHHGLRRLLPQCQAASQVLDCAVPGLHRDFFEFAWSIPGHLRKHRRLQELYLKRYHPSLLRGIPVVKDNRRLRYWGRDLPGRLRWTADAAARRCGIHPGAQPYYGHGQQDLFLEHLWPRLRSRVLSPAFLDADVLKPDYVRGMVGAVDSRSEIPFYVLGACCTLADFVEEFIDKPPHKRNSPCESPS